MNKYVIRMQRNGTRKRRYFPTREKARAFAKYHGIPYAQIKRNAA